jgi:hypothetical protein
MAIPAKAARKINVEELKQNVASMLSAGKGDEAVSAWLKDVELSEQLPSADRKDLQRSLPGPLCTEQLIFLAGRSAFLEPAAMNIPSEPAPGAAEQRVILAAATDFAAKSNAQSPHLTVTKLSARFQDSTVNTSTSPGLVVNANYPFAKLSDAVPEAVETDKGVEKPAPSKAKTSWGSNGLISEGDPAPGISTLLQGANATGKIEWLRWEVINGKKIAVFNFTVEKKKSRYIVNYCCFPQTDIATGVATPGGLSAAPGQIQSVTGWTPFKKTVGYHGRLYLAPDTGAIVRVLLVAEMKPSDFVRQEATRIDYGTFSIDGKEFLLPVNSYIFNDIVPNGGDSSRAYSERHTLFMVEYRDYRIAGSQ